MSIGSRPTTARLSLSHGIGGGTANGLRTGSSTQSGPFVVFSDNDRLGYMASSRASTTRNHSTVPGGSAAATVIDGMGQPVQPTRPRRTVTGGFKFSRPALFQVCHRTTPTGTAYVPLLACHCAMRLMAVSGCAVTNRVQYVGKVSRSSTDDSGDEAEDEPHNTTYTAGSAQRGTTFLTQ